MSTMCKQVGWGDRWYVVNLIGRSGGLLVGWAEGVTIHQIIGSSFCIEVEFESMDTGQCGQYLSILVIRGKREWNSGKNYIGRKANGGLIGFYGDDFNEIRKPQEKLVGRARNDESCKGFQEFIFNMNMEEVEFQGRHYT